MRKILLALLILSLPCASFAGGGTTMMMVMGSPPTAGGACSPTPTGDELTEGFESTAGSSGYESAAGTWTQTGATIDNQASIASAPTNSCSKGIQFNTSEAVAYARWDRGSTISKAVRNVYSAEFTITSWTLSNASPTRILSWADSTATNDLTHVEIWISGGQGQIRCTTVGDADPSTWVNITTGTWYRITVDLDAAAGADGSTCQLDTWGGSSWSNGSANAYTRSNGADRQYLWVGPYTSIAAGEAIDMTFGYVYMSTP